MAADGKKADPSTAFLQEVQEAISRPEQEPRRQPADVWQPQGATAPVAERQAAPKPGPGLRSKANGGADDAKSGGSIDDFLLDAMRFARGAPDTRVLYSAVEELSGNSFGTGQGVEGGPRHQVAEGDAVGEETTVPKARPRSKRHKKRPASLPLPKEARNTASVPGLTPRSGDEGLEAAVLAAHRPVGVQDASSPGHLAGEFPEPKPRKSPSTSLGLQSTMATSAAVQGVMRGVDGELAGLDNDSSDDEVERVRWGRAAPVRGSHGRRRFSAYLRSGSWRQREAAIPVAGKTPPQQDAEPDKQPLVKMVLGGELKVDDDAAGRDPRDWQLDAIRVTGMKARQRARAAARRAEAEEAFCSSQHASIAALVAQSSAARGPALDLASLPPAVAAAFDSARSAAVREALEDADRLLEGRSPRAAPKHGRGARRHDRAHAPPSPTPSPYRLGQASKVVDSRWRAWAYHYDQQHTRQARAAAALEEGGRLPSEAALGQTLPVTPLGREVASLRSALQAASTSAGKPTRHRVQAPGGSPLHAVRMSRAAGEASGLVSPVARGRAGSPADSKGDSSPAVLQRRLFHMEPDISYTSSSSASSRSAGEGLSSPAATTRRVGRPPRTHANPSGQGDGRVLLVCDGLRPPMSHRTLAAWAQRPDRQWSRVRGGDSLTGHAGWAQLALSQEAEGGPHCALERRPGSSLEVQGVQQPQKSRVRRHRPHRSASPAGGGRPAGDGDLWLLPRPSPMVGETNAGRDSQQHSPALAGSAPKGVVAVKVPPPTPVPAGAGASLARMAVRRHAATLTTTSTADRKPPALLAQAPPLSRPVQPNPKAHSAKGLSHATVQGLAEARGARERAHHMKASEALVSHPSISSTRQVTALRGWVLSQLAGVSNACRAFGRTAAADALEAVLPAELAPGEESTTPEGLQAAATRATQGQLTDCALPEAGQVAAWLRSGAAWSAEQAGEEGGGRQASLMNEAKRQFIAGWQDLTRRAADRVSELGIPTRPRQFLREALSDALQTEQEKEDLRHVVRTNSGQTGAASPGHERGVSRALSSGSLASEASGTASMLHRCASSGSLSFLAGGAASDEGVDSMVGLLEEEERAATSVVGHDALAPPVQAWSSNQLLDAMWAARGAVHGSSAVMEVAQSAYGQLVHMLGQECAETGAVLRSVWADAREQWEVDALAAAADIAAAAEDAGLVRKQLRPMADAVHQECAELEVLLTVVESQYRAVEDLSLRAASHGVNISDLTTGQLASAAALLKRQAQRAGIREDEALSMATVRRALQMARDTVSGGSGTPLHTERSRSSSATGLALSPSQAKSTGSRALQGTLTFDQDDRLSPTTRAGARPLQRSSTAGKLHVSPSVAGRRMPLTPQPGMTGPLLLTPSTPKDGRTGQKSLRRASSFTFSQGQARGVGVDSTLAPQPEGDE